jgi:ribonuclease Y
MGSYPADPASAILLPGIRVRPVRGNAPTKEVRVTEVLLFVLAVAVLIALVLVLVQLRRRPIASPSIDPGELTRLVSATVAKSLQDQPATPQTLGAVEADAAVLREEARAEAAEVRRAAAEAAEDLRGRARAEAEQTRQDARVAAEQSLSAARAEVTELRDNLAAERRRLFAEAAESVAADRAELQAGQLRLTTGQQALELERRSLSGERERVRADQAEVQRSRQALEAKGEELARQGQRQQEKDRELTGRAAELDAAEVAQRAELVRISGLTEEAARAELLARQEDAVRRDVAFMIRRVEGEAESTAKQRARAIVADAIQRVASDQTAQTVVSVVHLPAEEIKGRIIGREGRNIRAFETVTGVNVIIDDTPEAVLLSCFDPVRREIGRVTLEALIEDGRIHPHRIEEAYERATDEVEALCRRAAEDALLDVGISDLHPELVTLVGRLKYRTSYGQNVLGHLVETAHIAGVMGAELGIDTTDLVRGAFLHDIGKALTHEVPGSHALIGADLARKYGESETVVHCIEAHHDEVSPSTVEAVLTQAADACSGGRPGARRESLESYVQRLERIEAIANAKRGVEKVFAMQAGRELRVMVKPELVDDLEAHVLAREVAKQIEEELTYPGQVRVTVIRESRATEVAR